MLRLFFSPLLACAIATPAATEQYPDVLSCLAAAESTIQHDVAYDRFTWSSDPSDAVILRWEAGLSTTNPLVVATVVEVEGRARRRSEPAGIWEDVTVRCGLNDAKVEAVEIVLGHDRS